MTRFAMLALEQNLMNDGDGGYQKALLERLERAETSVKTTINRGLPPDDFAVATRFRAALEAAHAVVEKLWPLLQNNRTTP